MYTDSKNWFCTTVLSFYEFLSRFLTWTYCANWISLFVLIKILFRANFAVLIKKFLRNILGELSPRQVEILMILS